MAFLYAMVAVILEWVNSTGVWVNYTPAITNHFLVRPFNTDAVDILSDNSTTIDDLNNLYESLKPYWNDSIKNLIYTDTNKKVLSSFFDRNL